MSNKLKDPLLDQFFEAILSLQDLEECYAFFEDVSTIGELKDLSQRYQVAKMLQQGFIYEEIAKQTGASTATISRVKRCLTHGADGYQLIPKRKFPAAFN